MDPTSASVSVRPLLDTVQTETAAATRATWATRATRATSATRATGRTKRILSENHDAASTYDDVFHAARDGRAARADLLPLLQVLPSPTPSRAPT
jgi:hypothetical protein